MATCPECGVNSREDPAALTIDSVVVGRPVGSFSIAGVSAKVATVERLRLRCRCGWSVFGSIDGGYFQADAEPPPPGEEN